ncbi:MAG: hypothetical protein ACTSWY_09005 [Promethearchaeota archaeon]
MVNVEDLIQRTNNFIGKINTPGKILDYVTEEITPKMFKEKTEQVYELGQKIIDEFIHRL